jgi:DNA-binding IclR family transcriptional regulator
MVRFAVSTDDPVIARNVPRFLGYPERQPRLGKGMIGGGQISCGIHAVYDAWCVVRSRRRGTQVATQDSVQSVRRALQLLNSFTPERTQWSVSDLSRTTGLHKSVVARLMTTMASEGFLVQDEGNKAYTIGPQVFAIGSVYEPRMFLDRVARPVMQELAMACGQTCALGIPSGQQFMYVIVVENPRATTFRITVEAGRRRPYHAAAVGKVLLASMPEEQAERILNEVPLSKLTAYTIDEIEALRAELAEVQRTGVAFSGQESVPGVGAVAAGIRNANGHCVAALNVVYPFHLVSAEECETLTRLTRDAAHRISERVGCLAL